MRKSVANKILAVLMAAMIVVPALAQENEAVEKPKGYMSLKYVNDNGNQLVKFKVFTREKRKRVPVEFAVVNLYLNENSKLGMLGNMTTNAEGEGIVTLDKKFTSLTDTLNGFTFIGSMLNNPTVKETVVEYPVLPAQLNMRVYEEDSVRYVEAIAQTKDEMGEWVPLQDIEIYFYVKRHFSLLPLTEYPEYTDEDGMATIEFPAGIKGDAEGNLTIVTKINEHEDYGTYIVSEETNWGDPVVAEQQEHRLLSGSRANAPLALVIVANAIIIGVWGLILLIVIQLFRIRKYRQPKTQS